MLSRSGIYDWPRWPSSTCRALVIALQEIARLHSRCRRLEEDVARGLVWLSSLRSQVQRVDFALQLLKSQARAVYSRLQEVLSTFFAYDPSLGLRLLLCYRLICQCRSMQRPTDPDARRSLSYALGVPRLGLFRFRNPWPTPFWLRLC